MDTGVYMQNQMSDLIEASEKQMEYLEKRKGEIISIVDAVSIEPYNNPFWSRSYVEKYMEEFSKDKTDQLKYCHKRMGESYSEIHRLQNELQLAIMHISTISSMLQHFNISEENCQRVENILDKWKLGGNTTTTDPTRDIDLPF